MERNKMKKRCELCDRCVEEDSIDVLTIKLEELVTEVEIGNTLTLNVCHECIPTLALKIANGIVAASKQVRSNID